MVILQCKGAPYLERLTTILSSIWTSLTLFSMGVKRSDLKGEEGYASKKEKKEYWIYSRKLSLWGWTGQTWGEGRRPCSARRGGVLPACCGSGEQLLPATIKPTSVAVKDEVSQQQSKWVTEARLPGSSWVTNFTRANPSWKIKMYLGQSESLLCGQVVEQPAEVVEVFLAALVGNALFFVFFF